MKTIAVVPGTTTVRFADRPEPWIAARDDSKLRIPRVRIHGTDGAKAPFSQEDLVLGHEMI
jgi:threonine dehydrogenase-like Zn-dependent dehydrogenase